MTALHIGTPGPVVRNALLALDAEQLAPIEYHVYRGLSGEYLVARQLHTMGRYYSESSARELACWCAVMDAVRGQPARVHVRDDENWFVMFETTDHTAEGFT